jgi:hypothetical protein
MWMLVKNELAVMQKEVVVPWFVLLYPNLSRRTAVIQGSKQRSRYSNSLRQGWLWDRTSMCARNFLCFISVQIDPRDRLTSCPVGTRFLAGVKAAGALCLPSISIWGRGLKMGVDLHWHVAVRRLGLPTKTIIKQQGNLCSSRESSLGPSE